MIILSEKENELVIGYSASVDRSARERTQDVLTRAKPESDISFRELSEPAFMLKAAECGCTAKNKRNGTAAKKTDARGLDIAAIDSLAPAITILNSLLLEARERGASDIHLERRGVETAVRFRLDGVLAGIRKFDADTGKALTVRIKLLANLNTLETRRPQDGRFCIRAGKDEHDIRVSAVPCAGGESVVLRFLDAADDGIVLRKLGYTDSALEKISKIPTLTEGLVLVTGPTGSGKTTTLAALAKACDPSLRKIISIEDPVEYRIPGVIQVQTNEALDLDFSAILRRILRQDPDVILIGEIRDAETASLAVRAALTGHLVLSTLHAACALEAETRLADMGIPEYILRSVIKTVIAQRLVRHIVPTGFSGRMPIAECAAMYGDGRMRIERSFEEEIDDRLAGGITTQEEIMRVFGSRYSGGAK